jgi:hypothetical protein
MARVTPPIGSEGLFQLRLPFTVNPNLSYRVGGLEEFSELTGRGFDVFKEVYDKAGLTQQNYQDDLAAGAVLVTLTNVSVKPVFVPDTYVDSYPNMGVVAHNWVVATASCGMLPATYDTTRLTQAIQQAVADDIGVSPTVTIAVAPTTDAVTQTQAAAASAARLAAIKNNSTPYAQILKLQEQVTTLQNAEATYIELIETLQAKVDELEGSAPGTGTDTGTGDTPSTP